MDYLIVLEGLLDRDLAEWLGGTVVQTDTRTPATGVLVTVPDQSALHGVLARARDLNLPLVLVKRLERSNREAEADGHGRASSKRGPQRIGSSGSLRWRWAGMLAPSAS